MPTAAAKSATLAGLSTANIADFSAALLIERHSGSLTERTQRATWPACVSSGRNRPRRQRGHRIPLFGGCPPNKAAEAAFGRHREDELVLPASAYAEILVGPFRTGAAAITKVESFLTDFSIHIAAVDAGTAKRAALHRSRHRSLRLPDALVLATADAMGASKVLTANRTWTRISSIAEVI